MTMAEERSVVIPSGGRDKDDAAPSRSGPPLADRTPRRRGRGGVIVVAGPDGAGKSSLCDAITSELFAGTPVLRLHHRPGFLPYSRRTKGPVTEPHAEPPYSAPLSVLKSLYIFFDFLAGWHLGIRPFTGRGGWVLLERGWWDLTVDPRRYRLREAPGLISFLGRFLPKADLTVILEAPSGVLLQRKQELPAAELARQVRSWRSSVPRDAQVVYLDASRPIHELVRSVDLKLPRRPHLRPRRSTEEGWVQPPGTGSIGWSLPRAPRRASVGSLRLYHPVTVKGRVGWELARMTAAAGGFRFLPAGRRLPREVDPLLAHVPPGGTVAIAKTNHPARYVGLILDELGKPFAMAKIAGDDASRRSLELEREALKGFGPLLSAPLSPPRVLGHADGILLMEVVAWRLRSRPWRLPEEVAFALGRFNVAGRQGPAGTSGLAHGDFAPWNLMRTEAGWVLLDWEETAEGYPPFFDLFHYVVQAHALLGRPSRRNIAAGLAGDGWIGRAIRAYADGAGADPSEARVRFRRYLLQSNERLDVADPAHRSALRARGRLWMLGT
jgi:thymidylate kinase